MGSAFALLLSVGGFIKRIPLKVWGVLAGTLLVVLCAVWIEGKVSDHQEYVSGLESDNRELVAVRDRLNDRVRELGQINTRNQLAYDEKLRQVSEARRIADEEAQQALARAEYYRSVRNAATSTPEADRLPVDPVILDTIDRLWDDPAESD